MKSERRHELQHNELADWLEKKVTTTKPYTNAILGVLILVLAVLAAYAWWARNSYVQANMAWDGIAAAMDDGNASDLEAIAERYDGTNSSQWSSLIAGDLHLAAGCRVLMDNRDNANQELGDAVEAYNKVVDSSTPMFRQWAKFGLARALDAQCTFDPNCDTKKATEAYQAVIDESPDGGHAVAARRRLDDLKKPTTLALYRKINKYDPRPLGSDITNPFGNTPDFNLDSLRESGSDSLPSFNPLIPLDSTDGQSEDKTSTPEETSTPVAPATTPADGSTEE